LRPLHLPRDWRLITLLVSSFAVANALYSAWDQGWAFDERVHIAWSQRLVMQGVDERESLARFESKTPVVVPNVLFMNAARAAGITAEPRVRFAGRLPTVLWLAALLLATFHLARAFFGATAAHLATIATALDPNMAASGSLITVDVVYALAVVLTVSAALAFARNPYWRTGVGLGLALGLAFTAKFSALLLLPILALLPLVEPRAVRPAPGTMRRAAAGAGLAAVTAAAFVCAAYLFTGVGARLDAVSFVSRPFTALARTLPGLRLPLPRAFLTGIDRTLTRERQVWSVYILGRFRPNGVWYYFPLLWMLKTPLLVLLAEIAGFVQVVRSGILRRSGAARFLAICLLLNLVYFVFFFHTQIGYRFVLMCVPLGYAVAAAGLTSLPVTPSIRLAGLSVVAVALCENLMYWGNPLAFTNAAVWPKRSVWRLMAGSDVDYGQDRERIRRWLVKAHVPYSELNPAHILPGHNTVNLNALVGLAEEPDRYRWLRENVPPAGHIGYTHLWWILDDATYDRFMSEERQLPAGTEAAALCPDELQPYPAGARIPLSLDEPPRQVRAFVACISVRKQTDVALKVETGNIRFGPYRLGPACASSALAADQESWYRLEPGLHAFCVEEVPNRRERLPYRFEGFWRIRGRAAGFGLHERPRS
jgi:Dolichyl-phosphate-mannose-protein mannosyltransferase